MNSGEVVKTDVYTSTFGDVLSILCVDTFDSVTFEAEGVTDGIVDITSGDSVDNNLFK
jgi:hypothetical protein